jgi:wyosine [tRNA(Phe)-imidazoG37] synthetase (radical SAM superfamily)
MAILFDDIVFGPVKSRRFGVSLGINLLPETFKYCTFNCLYCECGWTRHQEDEKAGLHSREDVLNRMKKEFPVLLEKGIIPDNITFAGNGEPTIHPDFDLVIEDTIKMRDKYFPNAKITVLSNATLLHKKKVKNALLRVDNNVLKLDAGCEKTYQKINKPLGKLKLEKVVDELKKFKGNLIIQSLFLRGRYEGELIDNTTEEELELWLNVIKEVKPKSVMIYSIERETPVNELVKVSKEELEKIAAKVAKLGFNTEVY